MGQEEGAHEFEPLGNEAFDLNEPLCPEDAVLRVELLPDDVGGEEVWATRMRVFEPGGDEHSPPIGTENG